MRQLTAIVISVLVLATSNGCVTQRTLELARGERAAAARNKESTTEIPQPKFAHHNRPEDEEGQNTSSGSVASQGTQPKFYALLPLAVVADIAMTPGYLLYFALFEAYGGTN